MLDARLMTMLTRFQLLSVSCLHPLLQRPSPNYGSSNLLLDIMDIILWMTVVCQGASIYHPCRLNQVPRTSTSYSMSPYSRESVSNSIYTPILTPSSFACILVARSLLHLWDTKEPADCTDNGPTSSSTVVFIHCSSHSINTLNSKAELHPLDHPAV